MKNSLCRTLIWSLLCMSLVAPAYSAVTLIGKGVISGNASDQSGLSGLLEDGVTPRNQVGGLGSAIAYTGYGSRYVAVPDRGPADGATTYIDRLYVLDIKLSKRGLNAYDVSPVVRSTHLLRKKGSQYFTGSAAAFDATGSVESLRLDPEGVRVDRCGETAYVSDEYGPYIYEFKIASGKRVRALELPNKFLIDLPSATPGDELSKNVAGRQANRGMEGLAISPDGTKLYGIMQSPLIQDGALDAANSRVGLNARILEINVDTGAVREFLYQLDDKSNGVSEILAINDHELLVLERDGRVGKNATVKKIVKIDISSATDIRAIKQLPTSGTPGGVTPVTKSLFIDLLDSKFGIGNRDDTPEKFEGLAFGPDLDDGRHLLIVTVDNDFIGTSDNLFYAFAIDRADLPGNRPQEFSRSWRQCLEHRDDE